MNKKSNRIVTFFDDKTSQTLKGISDITGEPMTALINNAVQLFLTTNEKLANKALQYARQKDALKAQLLDNDESIQNNVVDAI